MQDEMTNKMFNKVLNVLSVEVIQRRFFFFPFFLFVIFSCLLKDVDFCNVLTS